MRFKDKVALITAVGSGIGRATADVMAAEGAVIIGVDNDERRLTMAMEAINMSGGRAIGRPTNALDESQVTEVVAWAAGRGTRMRSESRSRCALSGRYGLCSNPSWHLGGTRVSVKDEYWQRRLKRFLSHPPSRAEKLLHPVTPPRLRARPQGAHSLLALSIHRFDVLRLPA